MAKLKELIDQHRDQVPGLKVRRDHWEKFGWLEILDIRNGNAIGWNNYGGSTVQALDGLTANWELYQPPKAKQQKVTINVHGLGEIEMTEEQIGALRIMLNGGCIPGSNDD